MHKITVQTHTKNKKIKSLIERNLAGWLIMLPGVLLFVFFVWLPLVSNIGNSFFEMKGLNRVSFVWLDNYKEVFKEPAFLQALKNTFLYAFWSLVIGFLPPIILALILSEIVHFKAFFRLGLYFPAIISGMAAVIMWSYLFDPHPDAVLNALLNLFKIKSSDFLSNQKLAIPLIVVTMTWKGAGATMLIYLASFQNVDPTQYEASKIDGAGIFRRIWYITLPNTRNMISTLLILQVISVFQVFYEPLVMTKGGGPAGASNSLLLLSYQYFFESGDAAKSAAVAVILAFVIIILTVVYFGAEKLLKGKGK